MRIRERHVDGNTVNTLVEVWVPYGSCSNPTGWQLAPQYNITGSFVDITSEEEFGDVLVPNFEKRRDHGETFCNPMYRTFTQTVKTPIYQTDTNEGWVTLDCGGTLTEVLRNTSSRAIGTRSPDELVGSYPATPSLDENVIRDIAVTAAWANVSEADVNAYATLAESGKTVQSFLSITGRIIRLALQLSRGNLRAVWKTFTPKQLESHWMEGRYAIRPLLYDIKGVTAAIKAVDRPERYTYRGSDSATATNSQVLSSMSVAGRYRVYGRFDTSRMITARAGVLAALEEISTINRWGLDQPLEALWELVPASFIWDWFLNVGKVLASWTPNLGIRTLASWVTVENTVSMTKCIDHVEDLFVWQSYTSERSLEFSGGNCSTQTSVRTRLCHPARPLMPHMSVRLDAAKLLDLVILAKKLV